MYEYLNPDTITKHLNSSHEFLARCVVLIKITKKLLILGPNLSASCVVLVRIYLNLLNIPLLKILECQMQKKHMKAIICF